MFLLRPGVVKQHKTQLFELWCFISYIESYRKNCVAPTTSHMPHRVLHHRWLLTLAHLRKLRNSSRFLKEHSSMSFLYTVSAPCELWSDIYISNFTFSVTFFSVESWLSARNYCKSIGGDLPLLRHFEYLYHINTIAKPWPVYVGLSQVRKGVAGALHGS